MKKLKIMLGSVAFLFAVVAAFASKNVSSNDTLVDFYRQITNECEVETICSPFNEGEPCDYTVYQQKDGNECQTPILAYQPE